MYIFDSDGIAIALVMPSTSVAIVVLTAANI